MAILIDHRKIPRFRIVKRLHDLIHRRVDYDLGRGGNHELRYMETIIQLRTEHDIPDIIQRFHNLDEEKERERTEQSFFVSKDEIVENGYDLSINKYKKIEYIPVEYPPTEEILADIRKLEAEIAAEMDELEKLLKE